MFCSSYRPKEVISFMIETLQSTISTNNCKRRWNVSQCPQHNCIGSICNLRKKKNYRKSQITTMCRHTGGNIYPHLYLDTQMSPSSFVRSHMVSQETVQSCRLRTVTAAHVSLCKDERRSRILPGPWPHTPLCYNKLLQNPRLSQTSRF